MFSLILFFQEHAATDRKQPRLDESPVVTLNSLADRGAQVKKPLDFFPSVRNSKRPVGELE